MKETLLIYLVIGIFMNYIGPLARSLTEMLSEIKKPSLGGELLEINPNPLWKIVMAELTMRVSLIVLYPIFYIDFYRSKYKEDNYYKSLRDDHRIYFQRMGGAGTVSCNSCDFSQEIVSFVHGCNSWSKTGYQCQKCGEFHEIVYDTSNSHEKKCECGGNLDREKPLFCPKCKSKDISYDISFIT